MNHPHVSVVIPAFNSSTLIQETLSSVFSQQYDDFEVIVIDDGSTDGTIEVVQAQFPEARCVRQENLGVAAARNRGVMEARGRYIGFCDADDLWKPECLATKLRAFEMDRDLGLLFGNFEIFNSEGTISNDGINYLYPFFARTGKSLNEVFQAKDTLAGHPNKNVQLFRGNIFHHVFQGNFILTSTCIVRRQAAMSAGLFRPELTTQEDWEFFLRLSQRFKVGYVDEPLVRYRRHRQQLTNPENMENILEDVLSVIEMFRENLDVSGHQKAFLRRKSDVLLRLAKVRIRLGNKRSARRLAIESFTLYPRAEAALIVALTFTPHVALSAATALYQQKRRWAR